MVMGCFTCKHLMAMQTAVTDTTGVIMMQPFLDPA
jgi:hypothetical protein